MFKDDRDRGPLNQTRLDVVTVDRNGAEMRADAQRWENEGGASASERTPELQLRENAYHRSPREAASVPQPTFYVPALLAQLKLREQ